MAISMEGMPATSTMRKAAVPMIGGRMEAPEQADAATAPENVSP